MEKFFLVLNKEIRRSNLIAAIISGVTTFLAGSIPIAAYLILNPPFNIIVSLAVVAAIAGIFLVRYRSKKTRVHWKITLLETFAIVAIATLASLVLGGFA
jgi:VIT1/CCC1 family predicted Fe2+/Mn2+ transporter